MAGSPPKFPGPEELDPLFSDIDVGELLGSGGMGAVYKAWQPKLKRHVAIKILARDLAENPEFIARFEREAQAMARLTHPNIVTIFDYGDRGGYYYFVMEYIDGGDLRQRLRAGDLSVEEALGLILQVCSAIQFAHQEGFTHRDIKPANLLLDGKGQVKVADFGLAAMLAGNEDLTLTMTGTSMGTPFYMAPEQLSESGEVDHRADVFSLGVLIYQMLTGKIPAGNFPVPSEISGKVNSAIDEVVMRALAHDPDKRYHEVRELQEALEQADTIRGARSSSGNKGGEAGSEEEKKRELRGITVAVGASLAGLLLITAGFFWHPLKSASLPEENGKVPSGGQGETAGTLLEQLKLKTRPGRLRGIGERRVPGTEGVVPLDLAAADGIDDFVQVEARYYDGKFAALRANGQVITNDETRYQPRSGIRRLGQWGDTSPHKNTAYIDFQGQVLSPNPSGKFGIGELPSIGQPVIDAAMAHGHGLLLLENGRIVPWGSRYEDPAVRENTRSNPRFSVPEESDLANGRGIATSPFLAAILKADGSVVAWNDKGIRPLPPELNSGIREIAAATANLFALDKEGRVWAVNTENGSLLRHHCREDVRAISSRGLVRLFQTEDGHWHLVKRSLAEIFPDLGKALLNLQHLPAEAFSVLAHEDQKYPAWFVIWIEPANDAPESGIESR